MKKMPTLFVRDFNNHTVTGIKPELTSDSLSWVLNGEGVATEKIDGACCAVIDGVFYKRYDAKKDKRGVMKKPPEGSMPTMLDLLSRAEIAFSPSNKFDLIITYFVTNGNYDIFEINAALFKYGQPILGE